MRLSLFNKFDSLNNTSFQPITVQFTGPLILHADPNEPLHIATKRYVDNKLETGLNASNITSGIIPGARLPAFTGDVTSSIGSTVFTLANTGVVSGTYTKFTVDTKGRITSGSTLSQADIPDLSWSKVNVGRPTTLAGYGITDAVKATGDSLVGTLTITGTPSLALHAVNKQYVDAKSAGLTSGEPTGTIIRRTSTTVPSGFLRCNGGEVSKTTYAALYNVLLTSVNNVVYNTGKPWEHQFLINKETNTDIVSWNESVSLPTPVSKARACVIKGKVYLLGGNTGSSSSNKIYKGELTEEGVVTEWVESGTLPQALEDFELVVHDNNIYVLGGKTNTTFSNTTYRAIINPDGTLGTWTSGSNLPSTLAGSQALVIKNKIYMFGGFTSNSVTTANIYSSTIAGNGTLGSWATETGTLSLSIGNSKLVTTRNRIYLVGGVSGTTKQKKVMTIPINQDGTLGACSISPAGTQTAANASFTVNGATTVFPGNNNLTSVPTESVTINDLPTGSTKTANLVVPAGGFITVEYIRRETINLSLSGSGKLYLPNGVTSFDYTGAGSPGNPYVQEVYSWQWQQWLDNGTCYPSSTGDSVFPNPNPAGQQIDRLGWVGGCNYNSLGPGSGKLMKMGRYLSVLTSSGSSATSGQSGQLNYNGQTITLPAGYGGSYSTVQGTVNIVDQYPVINYNIPSGGQCTITYTFDNPNYFQTYLANTNITIPDYVTTVRVYGKGAHWLKELPVTVSEHAMYTTSDKAYIIGGGGVSDIYSTGIDEFGIFSSWTNEGNFPENLSFSTLVSVKDKLMLLGGVTASTTNKTYSSNFIGGLNDYTDIQTAVLGGTLDSNYFRLPDYSNLETSSVKYFIKYN